MTSLVASPSLSASDSSSLSPSDSDSLSSAFFSGAFSPVSLALSALPSSNVVLNSDASAQVTTGKTGARGCQRGRGEASHWLTPDSACT